MSTPAQRRKQKAYRRRVANGRAVLRIEIDMQALAEALIAAGRLDELRALDRKEIERQAAAIVEEWRRQWRP